MLAVSPMHSTWDLAPIWGKKAGFMSSVESRLRKVRVQLQIHFNKLRYWEASALPLCAGTSQLGPARGQARHFPQLGWTEHGWTLLSQVE